MFRKSVTIEMYDRYVCYFLWMLLLLQCYTGTKIEILKRRMSRALTFHFTTFNILIHFELFHVAPIKRRTHTIIRECLHLKIRFTNKPDRKRQRWRRLFSRVESPFIWQLGKWGNIKFDGKQFFLNDTAFRTSCVFRMSALVIRLLIAFSLFINSNYL